jgi:dTDP-4-dehydrorhamnose 3,5-epimerase
VPSKLDSVVITEFTPHPDQRGVFAEVYRQSWDTGVEPIQWNLVSSRANVYRGFHIHVTHSDYLMCVAGEMLLGLKDSRPESPTHGQTEVHVLSEDNLRAVTIPPGVAHGFYFPKPAKHLYSVSHYWNMHDELGCHWQDPAIGIDWGGADDTELSPRDQKAGSYDEMVAEFVAKREAFATAKKP